MLCVLYEQCLCDPLKKEYRKQCRLCPANGISWPEFCFPWFDWFWCLPNNFRCRTSDGVSHIGGSFNVARDTDGHWLSPLTSLCSSLCCPHRIFLWRLGHRRHSIAQNFISCWNQIPSFLAIWLMKISWRVKSALLLKMTMELMDLARISVDILDLELWSYHPIDSLPRPWARKHDHLTACCLLNRWSRLMWGIEGFFWYLVSVKSYLIIEEKLEMRPATLRKTKFCFLLESTILSSL